MKCSICDDLVSKREAYYGDEHSAYEGKPVCEICYYESEPSATIFYRDEEFPRIISDTRNETDGDFKVRWKSTDPWRGYYIAESEKYSMVNTAELLAYHQSQGMLEDFDEIIRESFDEVELDYARVFARSSNVFYQNYDLFVKKDQLLLGSLLVAKAKGEVDYNHPQWYRSILFDEESFNLMKRLFPEEDLKIDSDVVNLLKESPEKVFDALKSAIR